MSRPIPLLLAYLAVVAPATAADLCFTEGEWICCHFLCDVYGPVDPAGYSTTGPNSCGSFTGIFTLSHSATDPLANSGPIPDSQLYLWVNADAGYGFGNGWATLGGDLSVATVTPEVANVFWTQEQQRVDVTGCFFEPTLLATIRIHDPTDIDAETWARIKALWK